CLAWEQIAREAEKLGTRVVLLRTGLVLAPEGGFLGRLLPLYRLGLGGPLGDGRQWMPWIHIEDQIELIDFLLRRPDASGPYNACAPNPVRNRDFAKALG
ncbi:NAD-dependent epimerase/dehydratase family protein, partial [Klebsiella pneumoniae]